MLRTVKKTSKQGGFLLFLEVKYSGLDIANAFLEKHMNGKKNPINR